MGRTPKKLSVLFDCDILTGFRTSYVLHTQRLASMVAFWVATPCGYLHFSVMSCVHPEPFRQRQYDHQKHGYPRTDLHRVTTQSTNMDICNAVRTSDLTQDAFACFGPLLFCYHAFTSSLWTNFAYFEISNSSVPHSVYVLSAV
jgi:hypothetical protein